MNKFYIRLIKENKNICQEVTEEIYNKIDKILLKELKGGKK